MPNKQPPPDHPLACTFRIDYIWNDVSLFGIYDLIVISICGHQV